MALAGMVCTNTPCVSQLADLTCRACVIVWPAARPHTLLLRRERLFRGKSQTTHQKVLVRRTFLELEEDEYKMGRDQRRHKTTTVLPENSPILAA